MTELPELVLREITMFNNDKTEVKCNVCGKTLSDDKAQCLYCGWVQQPNLDNPDKIHWSHNFVSFNKAKKLYSERKPLLPYFNEFLECMTIYSELEFFVEDRHFGVITQRDGSIHFYEWNEEKGYQIYPNITVFAERSNIEGMLLVNFWNQVSKVGVAS